MRPWRALDKAAGGPEDLPKHDVAEAAGLRVLLTGMIRRDQLDAARQLGYVSMAENRSEGRRRVSRLSPRPQEGIECDPTQHDDNPQLAKQVNLFGEVAPASGKLARCRLVTGRGAPDGRGDVASLDPQAITAMA